MGLHKKVRGGGVPEIIVDQSLLTGHKHGRQKGFENNPFVSTGALTAARRC